MDELDRSYLVEQARRARGLTQAELAALAGTSQATLSAYERGLKSPSLKVASRILEATGHFLNLAVRIDWKEHRSPGLPAFWVPNILWSVETPRCFATLVMPDESGDGYMRDWELRDREDRKGAYAQLIRHGLPEQMIRWMDGALLVDVWDELDLPAPVREAWRWPIRLALEPSRPNPLGFRAGPEGGRTSTASIRTRESAAKPAPLPKPRPRRTVFDHRPMPSAWLAEAPDAEPQGQ